MSKKKNKKIVIDPEQFTALGFSTYQTTKGMTYSPTPRDKNRKDRRESKVNLKKQDI